MPSYFYIEKDSSVELLRSRLEDFDGFYFEGASMNRDNTMNCILKESPDIVFFNLDVWNTPFELVQELYQYQSCLPKFIGISKTTEKAFKALKYGFFDYWLLPLSELEIRKTIMKLQKSCNQQNKQTICLKSYKDYQYINTSEILFLKADNNSTDFYMDNDTVVSSFKTLKTYEEVLPKNFLRIHKSYIINVDHVSRIHFGKSRCTIKKGNFKIPFTKTYMDNVDYMTKSISRSSVLALN